ncbi:MAG: cytochrome c maturation protein CcmE [Rhodospirillales bacterium]|jgi:cytochrome c-type biogenesis protein CcmE|nr:cytochrome c maturation protein CcmE [Rhodospirillales bacterium]
MTPRKKRRLMLLLVGLLFLGGGAALVLTAFQDNIVFFYSPTDLATKQVRADQRLRIGGLVEEGSVVKEGKTVRFKVTDTAKSTDVVFTGLLPDLFREGQGVVAEGHYANGVFTATDVLAKHDEKYMPPEVADALKKSGQWRDPATQGKETGK